MASTDARPVPIKNTAFRAVFPILDADGDLVTGATGLDSEVSLDQGTFADCTNEATEIATASGMYYLDLTSSEMNADCVAVIVKTSSSGAKTTVLVFYPEETGDINVDVTALGGGAQSLTDLKDFADDGYDPSTNKVQGVVLTDTVTTLTGHTAQTGDAYAIVNSGTHGNAALKTLIDTLTTYVDTEVAAILVDTGTTLDDMVDDLETRITAALATALQAHAEGIGRVVVGLGSTTTAVVLSTVNGGAPSGTNDFYNGRHLVFTSGALALQACSISDYDGGTTTATVSALTGAPAQNVTAILV